MNTSEKRKIRRSLFGTPLFILSIAFILVAVGAIAYGVDLSTVLGSGTSLALVAAVPEAEFQAQLLGMLDKFDANYGTEIRRIKQGFAEFKSGGSSRPLISQRAAEVLAATTVLNLYKSGGLSTQDPERMKRVAAKAMEITGRTALTSSDIPLPVEYGNEVVALVAEFGAMRRWGTIVPIGAGAAKLPRLKTSPAFGLLAQSTAITEKSPQTEWVNFAVRKWGGMIRLPSEIAEDGFAMLGQFLALYAAREMAKIEDTVSFLADGTGTYDSITGIVKTAITAGYKHQTTGASAAEIGLSDMRTVRTKVNSAALANSAYYLSRTMQALLCTFNTSGNTPYTDGVGGPMLDGFPIRWVEVLPVYSTSDTISVGQVCFGDLRYAWLGVQGGFRFDSSNQAAFATDDVLVRALERFDIGLMAVDALAVVQLAAS